MRKQKPPRYPLVDNDFVLTQNKELACQVRCTLSLRDRINHSIKNATYRNPNKDIVKFITSVLEDEYGQGLKCWVWPDNSWCQAENGYIRVLEKDAILAKIKENTIIDQKLMLEERRAEIDNFIKHGIEPKSGFV